MKFYTVIIASLTLSPSAASSETTSPVKLKKVVSWRDISERDGLEGASNPDSSRAKKAEEEEVPYLKLPPSLDAEDPLTTFRFGDFDDSIGVIGEGGEKGSEKEFVPPRTPIVIDWRHSVFRLEVIRATQRVQDATTTHFSLVNPFVPGQIRNSPVGSLQVVSLEYSDQTFRPIIVKAVSGGNMYSIKVADLESDDSLYNEFLILRLLDGSRVAPTAHYLSPPWLRFIATARYLITDNYGPSIEFFHSTSRPSSGQTLRMGLEVLNLIERMHSIGVVHGDLNEFKVRIQANGELCLIDFESAVFIPEMDRTARSSFPQSSAEYLSPWEIQGFPYARRDDLFRWVEMLARLLYGEPFSNYQRTESFATIDGLLRFKLANMYFNMKGGRRRNIWSVLTNEGKHLAKGALNTVLAYVRTLGQETLPDYGFIYQKIESVIQILP